MGALILAPEGFEAAGLDSDCFYDAALRIVFRRMLAMREAEIKIDVITLVGELRRSGELDGGPVGQLGGSGFVSGLIDGIPTPPIVAEYARPVLEAARARRLIREGQRLVNSQMARCDGAETIRIVESIRAAAASYEVTRSVWLPSSTPEPPPWLVQGIVPVGGKLLLVGQAGAGKSYLAYDLAIAVITGNCWLGHEPFQVSQVEEGPVFIIDEENGPLSVPWRIDMLARRFGTSWKELVESGSLHAASRSGFSCASPEKRAWLTREISRLKPRMIVLDAAVRIMTGSDSDSEEVARFWSQIDAFARLGPSICIVHHAGWRDRSRPRGSTDWRAGCDVELNLSVGDDGRRKVTFGKVREGRAPIPFGVNFEFGADGVRLSIEDFTDGHHKVGTLADQVWEFVSDGQAGSKAGVRSVAETKAKFMGPRRKGKTQFYAAIKELTERTSGRRLVRQGDNLLATE